MHVFASLLFQNHPRLKAATVCTLHIKNSNLPRYLPNSNFISKNYNLKSCPQLSRKIAPLTVLISFFQDTACNEGSTTSMRSHLKLKHPESFREMQEREEGRRPKAKRKESGPGKRIPKQKLSASEVVLLEQKTLICDAWKSK